MFKDYLKYSKWIIILYHILTNLKSGLYLFSGKYDTTSGSIIQKKGVKESLNYINTVFRDYIKYGKIKSKDLNQKVVLEIGPGDNFGVALNFLIEGASKVICIDKFYPLRSKNKEIKFYHYFRNSLNENKKKIFDNIIRFNKNIKINQQKLEYHFGIGIEDALKILKPNSIDIIVSRSVLEHIYNINSAMNVINELLVPGGLMIHKIDFRDHKMFSFKHHSLEFLTIPKPLYTLMTKYSGKPNRKLMNYYYFKVKELKYNFNILITSILGYKKELKKYINWNDFDPKLEKKAEVLIKKIKSSLCYEFRIIPKKILMISGIFLIAKKPK
ncbi:MAG: class I SAM-dependent methyltransferase [Candidatus Helarchaeota archaeon]